MNDYNLTDMACTPKRGMDLSDIADKEQYPYGLRLELNSEALMKLGIKKMPPIGDEYRIIAIGKITSTSQNANESVESTRMEIQLMRMAMKHDESSVEEKKETFGLSGVQFK
jgi:hypothetical protein